MIIRGSLMTNLRQLISLVIVLPCLAQPTSSTVGGSISGNVLGDDGSPVAGAYVTLHLHSPIVATRQAQRSQFGVKSGSRGAFRFDGLSTGTYGLCVQATSTIWLDPCEWGFPLPSVSVASAQMNPGVTITMKKGVSLPIRIDDAGQLLTQHLGKTSGADLLIGISRPGQPFRPTIPVSEDASGRNHQFVIPFDTSVRLVVASSFFKLADAKGATLNNGSNGTTISVAAGQQPQPVHVTVIGRQ